MHKDYLYTNIRQPLQEAPTPQSRGQTESYNDTAHTVSDLSTTHIPCGVDSLSHDFTSLPPDIAWNIREMMVKPKLVCYTLYKESALL